MTGAASPAPRWLVATLADPPLVVKALAVLATVLVLAVAARRVYRRDGYISSREQCQILLIVVTVEAVALATLAALHGTDLGYVGVVGVGCVGGLAASEVLRQVGRVAARRVDDVAPLLVAAWWGLLVLAVLAYQQSFGLDVAYPPGLAVAVAVVSVVMLAWTVVQELGPFETVGEALRNA